MQTQYPDFLPLGEQDWPAVYSMLRQAAAEERSFTFPTNLEETAARKLWLLNPPGITITAFVQGDPAGSAKVGPNQMGPAAHIATASFLVDPRRRGEGVGRALALWSIEWARRQGYAAMQFNAVVETNCVAVALWRSLGFEVVGRIPEAFQLPTGERTALLVMHRLL